MKILSGARFLGGLKKREAQPPYSDDWALSQTPSLAGISRPVLRLGLAGAKFVRPCYLPTF